MSTKPILGFAQVLGPSDHALRDWLQVLTVVRRKIASGKALTPNEQQDLSRVIGEMERAITPTMVSSTAQRRLGILGDN